MMREIMRSERAICSISGELDFKNKEKLLKNLTQNKN